MKRIYTMLLIVILGLILSGCAGFFGWKNYEGSEQFREDVAVFADFAVRKQLIVLKYLEYTSDGFTKDILQGTVSAGEYDDFFQSVANMVPYIKDYENAFKALERSGILTTVNTKGIVSSGKAFLSWVTGSGQRSRERVLTVASNLGSADRTELYNKLRPEWKGKTSGESDFWKKVEKGDFDVQAPQMFNDFRQDNVEFALTSVEKGLTIQRITVLEGAAGVKAGAEFMTDVVGTATPLGTGIAAAQVGQLTIDLYNANSNADRAKIGAAIASNVAGMAWKDPVLGVIGGDAGVDLVVETVKETVDIAKTDAENTVVTKKSFVFVEDEDSQDQADIVIAQNRTSSALSQPSISVAIGNIVDEGTKFIYTILNKGKWLITAIDKNGNKSTKEVDVPAGDVILVTLTTTPPAKDSEQDSKDDFTDWNALIAQYPVLSAYPAFSGSLTYLEYTTDNLFYEAVKIRANTSDVDKYINTIKGKGYKKEAKDNIISYMSPNRIGDYWRYVQLYTSGVSGKTDVRFFNLK